MKIKTNNQPRHTALVTLLDKLANKSPAALDKVVKRKLDSLKSAIAYEDFESIEKLESWLDVARDYYTPEQWAVITYNHLGADAWGALAHE